MNRVLFIVLLATSPVCAQDISFTNANGRLLYGTSMERTASVSAADIDGDGDLDLVAAIGRHWPEQNMI